MRMYSAIADSFTGPRPIVLRAVLPVEMPKSTRPGASAFTEASAFAATGAIRLLGISTPLPRRIFDVTIAAADPALKPMFSVGDAFGPVETLMWVAKTDFIKTHREALVDFLADNIRMRRWMLDPKTRMDAVRQLADVSKIPMDRLEGWAYTNKDYFYPPNAGIDVQRLQKNVNDMAQVGVIPKAIDVTPYVDMSLVKDAEAKVAKDK